MREESKALLFVKSSALIFLNQPRPSRKSPTVAKHYQTTVTL